MLDRVSASTDSKDLLSEDDVKHVADDGKTVDGQTAEETTHEELGSVLETPAFSDEFLTNIVAVLTRSREEDVEEGFTAEDVTEEELNSAIQVLNDVIEGNVELPAAVEEYIISQAQSYYDEPIANDASVRDDNNGSGSGQQTVENSTGSISEETGGIQVGDDTSGTNETDDNLVNDNPEEDTNDAENGGTETDGTENNAQRDGGDDSSDETDENENKAGEGESEEERIAREEKERLEKEEAERLEKEEQDKKDKEEKERLEKEEKEKQEKEEREKTEKEAAEREAQEAAEREEAERLAREEAEREAAAREQNANTSDSQDPNTSDSHGSSSSSSAAESESVTVTWSGTSHSYQASSSDEAQAKPYKYGTVSLNFKSGSTTLSGDAVPTSFNPGDPLPGTSDSPYIVEVDEVHAPYYEFEGWYTTENSANNMTSSQRLESVPATSSTEGYSLWAAFKPREYTVTFVNKFPEIGTLVVPSGSSGDGLTYSAGQNGSVVASGLHYGDTYHLPEVERLAKWRYTETDAYKNYPYISVADGGRSNEEPNPYIQTNDLLFYSRQSDVNAAKVLVYNSTADSTLKYNPVMFTHAQSINSEFMESQNPRIESISISDNETLYMYFGSIVNIEINDAKITLPGGQAQTLASVVAASQGNQARVKTRVGSSEQYDEYWNIKKRTNSYYNTTDYVLNTVYFGLPIHFPSFSAPEGANPVYTDFTVESRGEFKINDRETSLYSKSTYSTETPLFTGTGTQHPFPVYNTSNTTELSCTEYVVEVNSREYAILDMSGADYYYYVDGDNNMENLGGGRFKTALISCNSAGTAFTSYSGTTPYNTVGSASSILADTSEFAGAGFTKDQFLTTNHGETLIALPDDIIYPWYLYGGKRTINNGFEQAVNGYNTGYSQYYPYVAKSGYKLGGYNLTYTDHNGASVNKNIFINRENSTFYLFNNNNGNYTEGAVAGTNILVLDTAEVASPITIKPLFVPETAFTVTTQNVDPGLNVTGKNAKLVFDNIAADYIDAIDLGLTVNASNNNTPDYNSGLKYYEIIYTDDSQRIKRTPLLGGLTFDKQNNRFVHEIGTNILGGTPIVKNSYTVINGKAEIPLFDLAYFPEDSDTTADNLRVLAIRKSTEDEVNLGNYESLNGFVNKQRTLNFSYWLSHDYGVAVMVNTADETSSSIRSFDPLAAQAKLSIDGAIQYIFTGCSISSGGSQVGRFSVEDMLKHTGLVDDEAAGIKVTRLSVRIDSYDKTDVENHPVTDEQIETPQGYAASNLWLVPQRKLISIEPLVTMLPIDRIAIQISYGEQQIGKTIYLVSTLPPQ
ncbi:MAG: hypothetical protein IK138_08850 [Lachnospiraceae bacterium]|nr:hypothetical protein [Lachnospiraceae bacterium]